MQNWWLEKLNRTEASTETLDMFGTVNDKKDDDD